MKLRIQGKLVSIVLVFVTGFVMYAATVHYTTHISLEQSDYRDVMLMKDLLADVVPPVLYVVDARVTARKASRETDRAELEKLRASWDRAHEAFRQRNGFWANQLPDGPLRAALLERSQRAAEQVFSVGEQDVWPAIQSGDAPRLKRSMDALETAFTEHRNAVDEVVVLTRQRVGDNEQIASTTISHRKLVLNALALAIVLLGAAVAVSIARGVVRRTRAMALALARVKQGDLSARAAVEGHDELTQMASMLNQSLDAIEHAFGDVRRVASALASSAERLAKSSDQIAQGSQQQAASLEETAASLEQITATIKQSAANAQQADSVARSSRDVATQGGSVVRDAVAAMSEVSRSSRRIEDIIITIDEIALQTNLLALNAAVEAARAGEQGRGFAVVASEVGNLAQRSAGAAKEVKLLIHDSLERIQASHALVGQSGTALDEIIGSAARVTDIVGAIATAAREQSQGVDQVNQAVSQMDQVTQSSASETQALSHTARELADSASQLQRLMERFRVRRAPVQVMAAFDDDADVADERLAS